MSISDQLAAITARADAATAGPWITKARYGFTYIPRVIVATQRKVAELVRVEDNGQGVYVPKSVVGVEFVGSDEDAEFIAHARADVPWLVEQVRKRDAALQAVLDLCDSTPLRYRPYGDGEPFMVLGVPRIRAAIEAALGEGA